jgi:hypothetical protein
MTRETDRCEKIGNKILPRTRRCANRAPVSCAISAQFVGGSIWIVPEHCRVAAVERMRRGGRWRDPLEAVLRQRQRLKEGGCNCHRVHRRTHVVQKTRLGQFRCAEPTADGGLRFVDHGAKTSLRRDNRGSEAIRSGADDGDIVVSWHGGNLLRDSHHGAGQYRQLRRSAPAGAVVSIRSTAHGNTICG